MERLKQATKSKTDKQLAEVLDLSPTSYSNRKNGDSIPFEHVVNLCRSRRISVDWVFTGEGLPFKDKEDLIAPITQIDEALLGEISCALALAMGRAGAGEITQEQTERAALIGTFQAMIFNKVAFVKSTKLRREMINDQAVLIADIYRVALKSKAGD